MSLAEPRPAEAVWLDANESPSGLDPEDAAKLAEHLSRVPLHRYPESSAAALRHHVAGQLNVSPDSILVGNGTEELVRLLCSTFSKLKPRESRPRVGYPVPSPTPYAPSVLSQGARPLEMPLKEDFGLDLTAMERQITGGHPNLLLFCRPNDPTGNLWSREEMEKIIQDHPEMVVAIDETYFDYCQETLLDLLPKYPHLVVLRSLSRIGLAGLRIGFLMGQPEMVGEIHKVRPAHNLSALALEAALWVLQHCQQKLQESVRQVIEEREKLAGSLAAIEGVRVWPSLGNFLLVQVADGPGVCRALRKRQVAVTEVPESGPLANCLRITVGSPPEHAQLLQALPEAIANPEPAPPVPRHKQAEVVGDDGSPKGGSGLPRFL